MTRTTMGIGDTLLAFSEWLDGQGLLVNDGVPDDDTRTHEDLAVAFLAWWAENPARANLLPQALMRSRA